MEHALPRRTAGAPRTWSLCMTSENHGTVGPAGCTFSHAPEKHERVLVVEVPTSASAPVDQVNLQLVGARRSKPVAEFKGYVDGQPAVTWLDHDNMPSVGTKLFTQAAANKAAEEGELPQRISQLIFDNTSLGWDKASNLATAVLVFVEADRASRQVANKAEVEPSHPTDMSQRMRAAATADIGMPMAKLLIGGAEEIERYYGGMMAWKQTASKKDADYNTERMARINERCAARATPPATTGASTAREAVLDEVIDALTKRFVVKDEPWVAIGIVRALKVSVGASTVLTDEPKNGIAATHRHDEGAIARCSYCGRYSLDPATLSDRQPACECGKQHGWCGSFKKPEPDSLWSGKAPVAREVAAQAGQVAVPGWMSVDDSLPDGKYGLATYQDRAGKLRIIRAMYVRQFEIDAGEDAIDQGNCEYNEADDTFYLKAGWLECIDNWDDYSSIYVTEGKVTHWMPLPAAPSPAKESK